MHNLQAVITTAAAIDSPTLVGGIADEGAAGNDGRAIQIECATVAAASRYIADSESVFDVDRISG